MDENSDEDNLCGLFGADAPEPEEILLHYTESLREMLHCGTKSVAFTQPSRFLRHECIQPPHRSNDAPPLVLERDAIALHRSTRHHSLWGHQIWNAAKFLSKSMLLSVALPSIATGTTEGMDSNPADGAGNNTGVEQVGSTQGEQPSLVLSVRGAAVLELGAGLGVPSIVAHLCGARVVVATDYSDESLLKVLHKNLDANRIQATKRSSRTTDQTHADASSPAGGDDDGDEGNIPSSQTATAGKLFGEPLTWGNDDHIEKVLRHCGGSGGFDIIILSDIVFNHVCHRDLLKTIAATMQKDKKAAAYCVFSHHRPHKLTDDMKFFDLCLEYGLCFCKIGQEDYPLMFPLDPGPPEIRGPVHCYRIQHVYDDAGPPLDATSKYDCVVQGSGLTEALLSAGLSRYGLRVLHVDAMPSYGGAFASTSLSGFAIHLEKYAKNVIVEFPIGLHKHLNLDSAEGGRSVKQQVYGGDDDSYEVARKKQQGVLDFFDALNNITARTDRQFNVDTLPMTFMAQSNLVSKIASSQTAKHWELANADRLVFLFSKDDPVEEAGEGEDVDPASPHSEDFGIVKVPLNKSDVFTSDFLSPLEMRRLMKFMKDVEDSAAPVESSHPATARPWHGAAETESFPEFLGRKYNLSASTVGNITMHGTLMSDSCGPSGIQDSFKLVRTFFGSVGKYDGSTPFLLPMYGCSELPQTMCRVSSVWNGTFVLRRWVKSVEVSDTKSFVVLSNGQRLEASCVVVPAELLEQPKSSDAGIYDAGSVSLSRVVVVFNRHWIKTSLLGGGGGADANPGNDEDEDDSIDSRHAPTIVAVWPLKLSGKGGKTSVVGISVVQVGSGTQQAPPGCSVVHFTVSRDKMSPKQLLQHVARRVISTVAAPEETGDSSSSTSIPEATTERKKATQLTAAGVIMLCGFELSARDFALHSSGGTVPTSRYVPEDNHNNDNRFHADPASDSIHIEKLGQHASSSSCFPVRTLFTGLDDGQYCQEAEQAFQRIVRRCKSYGKHPWSDVPNDAYKQMDMQKAVNSGEKATGTATDAAVVSEVEVLAKKGSGGGGGLDNAVVFLEEVPDVNAHLHVGEDDRDAHLLAIV